MGSFMIALPAIGPDCDESMWGLIPIICSQHSDEHELMQALHHSLTSMFLSTIHRSAALKSPHRFLLIALMAGVFDATLLASESEV